MKKKAVVDRVTDGKKAVLLIGDNEVEYIVQVNQLPRGVKEGDWLQVKLENDELVDIVVDHEQTKVVKKRVENKLARLRQKGVSRFCKRS